VQGTGQALRHAVHYVAGAVLAIGAAVPFGRRRHVPRPDLAQEDTLIAGLLTVDRLQFNPFSFEAAHLRVQPAQAPPLPDEIENTVFLS